jgi:hypothetical protein
MIMKKNLIALITLTVHIMALPFEFTFEPIDAVIPCHKKDTVTLDLVVDGIRRNVKNIRRIIVVSQEPYTDKAEWFDERNFPFTKESIAYEIFQNEQEAQAFLDSPQTRIGWIFQQFLKSYSIFVIPDISANMLIVDADTIFLRPVEFQDPETGAGLYNPSLENHTPYFLHLARVLPGFKKVFPRYSGISHHMLFQRSVMEELFAEIRRAHNKEPWKVFCEQVDKNELYGSCMCVEYELYFNFVFSHSDLVKVRHLKWDNMPFYKFHTHKDKGYDYLSCHSWQT